MASKHISFIIPHKGRELFLQQTIESISNQEYDLDSIEVIVVTQNESLSEATLSFGSKLSLSVHTRPVTETISALRNYGVSQSSGSYLAFLDADISLSHNWISSLLSGLKNNNDRVLISAAQICTADAPPLEQIKTALSNAVINENVNFLPGRNLLLSKQTFDKSGGFPEHLITCEDYYFTDQVHHLGNLYYTSEATYIHLGEDKDYMDMYHKEIWRGQSNLLSIKGRKIPLREIPSFVVPLGIFLMLLVSLVAILLGYYAIATISLALFLFPIFIYSLRLYSLAREKAKFYDVLKFYLFYFPARAIGTLGGLFKTFKTGSHN